MTVERLIEELKKLPQNVLLQEVCARANSSEREVDRVVWEGNHVVLEVGSYRG